MFRILLMAAVCLIICECASYGDVYVANDQFKQARIVTLNGTHYSEETRFFGETMKQISVVYSKTQKPGIPAAVEMKLTMSSNKDTDLRNSCEVLIDATSHDVQLIHVNRTMHVFDKNPPPTYAWEPKTVTTYKLFGTVVFSPELWQKMMAANGLGYRIFVDQLPYTFQLKPDMLEKLRLFSRQ